MTSQRKTFHFEPQSEDDDKVLEFSSQGLWGTIERVQGYVVVELWSVDEDVFRVAQELVELGKNLRTTIKAARGDTAAHLEINSATG